MSLILVVKISFIVAHEEITKKERILIRYIYSFRGLHKLWSRPDWSLLGVKFKISDEHPRPFRMGVPYGGPQVHTKFKSLTLYSNHSRRIQIAHTKNQIFTPNSKTLAPNSNHPHQKSNLHTEFKNTRTKFKSLTPKIKSSHRIQITHTEFKNTRTKFKSLTPKIKSSHRIQITHTEFKNTRTKFKSLTPNSNLHTEFKSLTPN